MGAYARASDELAEICLCVFYRIYDVTWIWIALITVRDALLGLFATERP